MSARQTVAGVLLLSMLLGSPAFTWRADAQATPPAPSAPPAPAEGQAPTESTDATPPRVSYINGQVSFWRPGADDWAPAKLNTPLAPGDVLYAGPDGNVEIQVGAGAFVRAAEGTQIGLDNQEPDFIQLRVTGGRAASTRNVPPAVYGAEALEQHGSWRTVETYGAVWAPASVPPGWVPYSAGRWIWDPRFGWTWLDDAPWGWAPYHYGRWVFVGRYWAWAPGPVIVRPVYSPALVVFLGGGVRVGSGVRPLCCAPVGWGRALLAW